MARLDLTSDKLQAVRHNNHYFALGLACSMVSAHPPFRALQFGDWVAALNGAIKRGHYYFATRKAEICGMIFWAQCSKAVAEDWMYRHIKPSYEQCLSGDCIVIISLVALDKKTLLFLRRIIREKYKGLHGYYLRMYKDTQTKVVESRIF